MHVSGYHQKKPFRSLFSNVAAKLWETDPNDKNNLTALNMINFNLFIQLLTSCHTTLSKPALSFNSISPYLWQGENSIAT
jgi:hypothetical protein